MADEVETTGKTVEEAVKLALLELNATLDEVVLKAYGFTKTKDLLAQLLELNSSVADSIARGEPVEKPGSPSTFTDLASLVTSDCVTP